MKNQAKLCGFQFVEHTSCKAQMILGLQTLFENTKENSSYLYIFLISDLKVSFYSLLIEGGLEGMNFLEV